MLHCTVFSAARLWQAVCRPNVPSNIDSLVGVRRDLQYVTGACFTAKVKLARSRARPIVIEAQEVGLIHLSSVHVSFDGLEILIKLLFRHDEYAFFLIVRKASFFFYFFEPLWIALIAIVDLVTRWIAQLD